MGLWVTLWVTVGVLVTSNISDLDRLPDTLDTAASALDQTASGIRQFEDLPFVGGNIASVAEEIESTAGEARSGADEARESIGQVAWLLGIIVVAIPTVPVLAAYLPWRIARVREIRSVKRALARRDRDQVLEHLAHRAVTTLPLHRLMEVTDAPWRDLHEGRHERLAVAELERLGIALPDLPAPARRDLVDARTG